jgi:hypothetical protein
MNSILSIHMALILRTIPIGFFDTKIRSKVTRLTSDVNTLRKV